jgi:hypothetical protein
VEDDWAEFGVQTRLCPLLYPDYLGSLDCPLHQLENGLRANTQPGAGPSEQVHPMCTFQFLPSNPWLTAWTRHLGMSLWGSPMLAARWAPHCCWVLTTAKCQGIKR